MINLESAGRSLIIIHSIHAWISCSLSALSETFVPLIGPNTPWDIVFSDFKARVKCRLQPVASRVTKGAVSTTKIGSFVESSKCICLEWRWQSWRWIRLGSIECEAYFTPLTCVHVLSKEQAMKVKLNARTCRNHVAEQRK